MLLKMKKLYINDVSFVKMKKAKIFKKSEIYFMFYYFILHLN
jgi:hypothetical protein